MSPYGVEAAAGGEKPMNMHEMPPEDQAAMNQVRSALERAGLQATDDQLRALAATHARIQARLSQLRKLLPLETPLSLVFPTDASLWGEEGDDDRRG
jgi:hypothetical protein